ncbi:hypothetical protein LguiB_004882 [Lonicera macranthoides]
MPKLIHMLLKHLLILTFVAWQTLSVNHQLNPYQKWNEFEKRKLAKDDVRKFDLQRVYDKLAIVFGKFCVYLCEIFSTENPDFVYIGARSFPPKIPTNLVD